MALIYGAKAKEMGIETHAFSFDEDRKVKDAVTQYHLVNILEKDKVLEICRSLGVDGVVPTTELTFHVAAYIAEKMGLNGMPFDVAKIETEKQAAIRDIRAQVAQLSVQIAEKVVRQNLSSDAAQMQLIDRMLDEVQGDNNK